MGENNSTNHNYVVGAKFFNKTEMSANAGLFADAVHNMHLLGIIISPMIIIIIIRIYSGVFENIGVKLAFIPMIIGVYYLNNSSLFTALMSHGILSIIILFWFINKRSKYATTS